MDLSSTTLLRVAALGFAPGLFWLWYIVRRDKWEPEPARYIVAMYFWGMVSTVIPEAAAITRRLIEVPPEIASPLGSVVFAPLVEESSKFLFLFAATRRFKGFNREFDEPMDGIVYASAIALGFASLENVNYMLVSYLFGNLPSTFYARAFLSVPGHMLFSGMWGYAWGMARFAKKTGKKAAMTVTAGLGMAMLFHGVFNSIAMLSTGASLGFLALLVAAFWLVARRNIRIALDRSPFRRDE